MSKAGEMIIPYIEEHFKKHAFHACRDAKIVIATLGNNAGIMGAARMAIDD